MKDLFKENEDAWLKKEKFIKEQKDAEKQKEKIIKEYNKKIDAIKNNIQYIDEQSNEIKNAINKYSYFNSDDITIIITKLLNSLTDKTYVNLKKACTISYNTRWCNIIIENRLDENELTVYYFEDEGDLNEYLEDSKKAVFLGYENGKVTFQEFSPNNAYSYSSFFQQDIISEFTRHLINYKNDKEITDLTLDEMNEILDEYIKIKKGKALTKKSK